jgi:predicted nucleotidyltransferase
MVTQELILKIQKALSKDKSIIAGYVLGSMVNGNLKPDSDFDLAVMVEKKSLTTESKIYNLIAGISFPKDLDLSVVDKDSSPVFLFQAISTGVCLYKRSYEDKISLETNVAKNYYDTSHIRDIYYSYLKDKFPYAN